MEVLFSGAFTNQLNGSPIFVRKIRTRRQLTEANVREAPSTLGAEETDHVVFVFSHHQALSQMNDYDGLEWEEKKIFRLLGNSMIVLEKVSLEC